MEAIQVQGAWSAIWLISKSTRGKWKFKDEDEEHKRSFRENQGDWGMM